MTVLLGARNAQLGDTAAKKLQSESLDARYIAPDQLDETTISAAAAKVGQEFGRLDVLVNNAGIVVPGDGMPETADLASVRKTFATNFFGVLAVTQAFLPLLRKAPAARVVNVSSGLGSLTLNADPASGYADAKPIGYNSSKAALKRMTVQLAWELKDTAIKVNAANPGYTATDLNGNSGHQTVKQGCGFDRLARHAAGGWTDLRLLPRRWRGGLVVTPSLLRERLQTRVPLR